MYSTISDLTGRTLSNVKFLTNAGDPVSASGSAAPVPREVLVFEGSDGGVWQLYHEQDCCENVWCEDVCGDLEDLIGSPILGAEEVLSSSSHDAPREALEECDESWTWTFYRLWTAKGLVVLRWYGASNGYYSETVAFRCVTEPKTLPMENETDEWGLPLGKDAS